jgi:hypothetical protein
MKVIVDVYGDMMLSSLIWAMTAEPWTVEEDPRGMMRFD